MSFDDVMDIVIFSILGLIIISGLAAVTVLLFHKKQERKLKTIVENTDFHNRIMSYQLKIFGGCELHNVYETSRSLVGRFRHDKTLDYLVKYFGMRINDDTVQILNSFAEEVRSIENLIHGKYMQEYFENNHLPYYRMQYISPAKRKWTYSTFSCTSSNLAELAELIAKKQSQISKQINERNKMTASMRELILSRDKFTCQICGNSRFQEPNLLLEVDHVIPISKGGKTEPNNLQTLCWKCNRSKSDSIEWE